MILLLLLLTGPPSVQFSPASPLIGDRVVLVFPTARDAHVTLRSSNDFRVVRTEGNRVTIQPFRTGEVEISGEIQRGTERVFFSNLVVRVGSVLAANDALEPAPLAAPSPLPPDARPFWYMLAAALIAAAPWIQLARARKRGSRRIVAPRSAGEELLAALQNIERKPAEIAWPLLADAARIYLARVDQSMPRALTTSELLRRAGVDHDLAELMQDVLVEGDYAKFSPWGPRRRDVTAVAAALRALPSRRQREA